MRILVLNWRDLAHPKAGGAEVFTDRISRCWAEQGHDVTWFCAAVDGQPEDSDHDGVRIVRRGTRVSVYREARRFYEAAGPGAFDLVLDGVNTRPFLTPRWVRDSANSALVHQVCREIWWHEAPFPVAVIGRFWLERRWLSAYADVPVLTPSESSRSSLEDYGLRDLTVIHPGIDTEPRAVERREERPTLVFVGRLSSNKQPLHALRAFARLQREVPDAQLWFIGDGPQRKRLQRRASSGVTFFGRVSEERKYDLLSRAHLLVVTSVREGWGLVVDEAAAVGTRTIAYDVPGLRDSVPAAGGTLVHPSPKALAAGLAEMLPAVVANPPPSGWRGGAVTWEETASAILSRSVARTAPEAAK
jgi:glycosyltransferase involved in cell wall biosynthesis